MTSKRWTILGDCLLPEGRSGGQLSEGLFAAYARGIVRIHASSGTTGKPKVAGYTSTTWICGEKCGQSLTWRDGQGVDSAGFLRIRLVYGRTRRPYRRGDHRRDSYSYEQRKYSEAGHVHAGHEEYSLACTPSYALTIAEESPRQVSSLRSWLSRQVCSELSRGPRRCGKALEAGLGIKAHDIYGLSEIIGPGVSISWMRTTGCIYRRITSIPRSSTLETLEPFRTDRSVNWYSRLWVRRASRLSGTGRGTCVI